MAPKKKPVKISAMEEDILTVLIGRELYGLEILDQLNPGRPIPTSFSSLYPTLNRLDKKGLIEWRWGDESEDTGGARRKYFKVSGLGARILNDVRDYRSTLRERNEDGQTAMGILA